MRVVLDTNVLLSGLAYPQSLPGRIAAAWQHGSLEVVLSHYILNELARVLPKLTHRHGMNAQEIADLVDIFAFQADLVESDNHPESRLTDPMDLPVLNTWRAAQADYLLTGDKALLALGNEYPIITPAQFWQMYG